MKIKFTFILFVLFLSGQSFAQVSFTDANNSVLIDFQSSITGVNQNAFSGSGLAPSPGSGQLDGDAWAISGLSDGTHDFGQTHISGDFARGQDGNGTSTGGLYSFDTGSSNYGIGIQPTGSDWTPGNITLKIDNNSSSTINQLTISYTVFVRNDQDRSSSFNLSHSSNNSSYTDESSVALTSPTTQDASPSWLANNRNIDLQNLGISPGGSYYLRWSGSDIAGSGSRDEFALDDISIQVIGNSNNCVEPTSQATNLSFGTIGSNFIQGNFSPTAADNYLILRSTSNSLSANPIDGLNYTPGNTIGNGTVVQYSNSTLLDAQGLQSNTPYFFFIFSANDNCIGAPEYLTVNPLSGSASTTTDPSSNYYNSVTNQVCADLKTVLYNLVKDHTTVSYNALWTVYQTTDTHQNDAGNQTIVWDMYSDNPGGSENEFTFVNDQCGTYQTEADCYNREHSFPKSWWGGTTNVPMYTDIFLVVPVDGWINGVRNNNPYGEVQAGTETQITNNGSRLGSSSITIPGYTASVFEPIDAYKGDFARGYFYMATRYENLIDGWQGFTTESDAVMDGTSFPAYEPWMITMLLDWHNNDPVSQKEIDRNEAIFGIQGNRNPFIDHPEYAALVWGACGTDTQAPTAPANLSASNTTTNSTTLNWSISTDNVGVAGYYIYQNGSNIGSVTGNAAVVNGLTPSTTYSFYVSAFDAAGNESANSNTIIETTDPATDTQAPTAPTNLSASNTTQTSTDLTWNASSDNVGVSGYNVYQDGLVVAFENSTSSNLTTLSAATTYSFYITAIDAAGNESAISNSISVTTDSPAGPTVLHEGYFESGWDGWQDGGSDCAYYSGSYSAEGSSSIRIRDNSGTSSAMTSPSIDLTAYTSAEISFSFAAKSMETDEDFWLRYYDGSSWTTIDTYIRGIDFSNNIFYTVTVNINSVNYNFASNSKFRFQCDASGNNDQIYIDEVVITGDNSPAARKSGAGNLVVLENKNSSVSDFAGIEEDHPTNHNSTLTKNLKVYPNPASNWLSIEWEVNEEEALKIEVFNANGKRMQVLSPDAILGKVDLDISTYQQGIYFLSLIKQSGVETKSFIVQ